MSGYCIHLYIQQKGGYTYLCDENEKFSLLRVQIMISMLTYYGINTVEKVEMKGRSHVSYIFISLT